ncbi:M56 family metallopeptidase [Spirillospora sp. NPDC029432]|uniref:M56 family metallopeptidase n=1 Tax=Spirillospora sp. NPDC029432 TaxID=3154599 RepID=UPI00345418C2
MVWLTFLPAVLTIALGAVLGEVRTPLHPAWSARLLATVAGTTAVTAIGTLVFVTVNYAATLLPGPAEHLPEWALFGDDRPVHSGLGVPATLLTCACAAGLGRLAVRSVRETRAARRAARRVVDSDEPLALAVPGRGGGVLVSRGLLRSLDRDQLRVVFQHEASHLRHRHHRYLALGALAAGTVPVLRRLNARLRFTLERWADEDAAEAVGDRALVARTIAQVALAATASAGPAAARHPFPAFSGSGVVQRVEALLATPPPKNPVTGPVTLTGAGLATGGMALIAWQLDHALGIPFL